MVTGFCFRGNLSVEPVGIVCNSGAATFPSVMSNYVWVDVFGTLQEAGFAKQEQSFQRRLAEVKELSDKRRVASKDMMHKCCRYTALCGCGFKQAFRVLSVWDASGGHTQNLMYGHTPVQNG